MNNIQEQIKSLEERFQKELSELKEKATQEEKKQEFKEGGYAKIIKESNSEVNEFNYSPFKIGEIFRIGEISTQQENIWLRSEKGKANGVHSNLCIVPTPEEVESHLIEEAKKRYAGKVGRVFKNARSPESTHVLEIDEFKRHHHPGYKKEDIAISPISGFGLVYWNGQWAELLHSTPEIEINGHKAEFKEWGVSFNDGCAKISKEFFIELAKCCKGEFPNDNRRIEKVTIGKGEFTRDQIIEIASYYEKEGE